MVVLSHTSTEWSKTLLNSQSEFFKFDCQQCNCRPFNVFVTLELKNKHEFYCLNCVIEIIKKNTQKKQYFPCVITYFYKKSYLIEKIEKATKLTQQSEENLKYKESK